MSYRDRSNPARQGRLSARRLRDLEDRLEETERRVVQLENTLKGVVRETDEISIAGPCACGDSLLIVSQRTIRCPTCQYRRAI